MYARKSGYFSRVLLPIISRLQMGKSATFSLGTQLQFRRNLCAISMIREWRVVVRRGTDNIMW